MYDNRSVFADEIKSCLESAIGRLIFMPRIHKSDIVTCMPYLDPLHAFADVKTRDPEINAHPVGVVVGAPKHETMASSEFRPVDITIAISGQCGADFQIAAIAVHHC